MLENLTEMLKGVLEGSVLEIISREETYGYEITRRLNALGFTDVVEGTVYTILIRLEKNKLVEITKKPSDMGPPRKFFLINEAGREELRRFWEKWAFDQSENERVKGEKTMNFWEKITGNDMKKEMKTFESRVQKLPADYQAAWKEINANLWPHTDFTGRNLMTNS